MVGFLFLFTLREDLMNFILSWSNRLLAIATLASLMTANVQAASVQFVGTHADIGGTFFPAYNFPQASIVPWRSDSANNLFAVSSTSPNRYYGTAGYALFATQFAFPNANPPGASNAFIPIDGNADFENILGLPTWVTDSEVVANRIAGGFTYALIDDPRLQGGERWWTFDGTDYPAPDGTNTTGVVPYVKLGVITGDTMPGRTDPGGNPDRWQFTVGNDIPYHFRFGIMTDGMDNSTFAPGNVYLRQEGGDWASSNFLAGNRFVDMHFFDVVGAQPGDTFIMSGTAPGRVSGFSFDVVQQVIPEPGTLALLVPAILGVGLIRSRRD